MLARPNHLADDGISRFLISHLEAEIESLGNEIPVETLVEREISRSLSEGIPRMADVARRLAMSERTLHRRLSGKERLVQEPGCRSTRRHVAENLLRRSRYPVTEVAFLTGFSEQSAFQPCIQALDRTHSDRLPQGGAGMTMVPWVHGCHVHNYTTVDL